MANRKSSAPSRRRHLRKPVQVKAILSVGGDKRRSFEATLPTRNISVGGIFFESTFFLKVGQRLKVALMLPSRKRVQAEGIIARVETPSPGRRKSGFALEFDRFVADGKDILTGFSSK